MRSKSGLSMLSSTSNSSSLELDSKPVWGRSKSSESIGNKPSSSNSSFKLPSMRRKANNIYNINGVSQSLDAIPIMEDDESEAALNVPILPMFKDGGNTLSKSTSATPPENIRKPKFNFGDSEENTDTGTPFNDTDLEKNEIDDDFQSNWFKSDLVPANLKRKPNANERKKTFIQNEPSSDDDDASTEREDDEDEDDDPQPFTTKEKDNDGKSIVSSVKSGKEGFFRNVFRSRTKSNASRKDVDLELGNDLSIEKIPSTNSNVSSMKSQKLMNKLFTLDGFLIGGGLTPNSNISEPYHGIEDEKKNADYIVQQAMKGLHREEPPQQTIQVGNLNGSGSTTGFDKSHDQLTNRRMSKKDSEVYIPNDLQDHEFDDLQNFDDYSIDVPSLNDGERRKRAGIGSLLMKLNNTTAAGTNFNNSSYASSIGYSNFTSDDEFTDQATSNLKDILSVNDFEVDRHDHLNGLGEFNEFEKIASNTSFNTSIDAVESKTQSLLRKVGSKPASIKNFILNETSNPNKRKANHQRTQSESNKKNMNIPDFYFKQQQSKDQQRKKRLFKRKKENAARITVHIADLLARQRFILLLCKAFMLFGAPTHRLEEYMAMTASVLEVDGSFVYFPGTMIVSFGDVAMRTSEMRLVRCNQGLDLSKLDEVHDVYKGVVHDRLGVEDGCRVLNEVISKKPKFNKWVCTFYYAFCSACVCTWGFGGSWIDIPISFGVGAVIGFLQFVVCPINTLYSSVFEVTSSIVASFIARAIGSINGGNTFCYASIVQSSLALILPGYIILCGSLELQSRNLVAGSVRMFYAFIYSLMLSFGITLGAALYGWIDHGATSNTSCTSNVSPWFRFLFVPGFTIGIALCNQASWKQLPMMVLVSGGGYVVTYFSSLHFKDVTELNATLGCFIIGLIANVYSRMHKRLLKRFKNFGFGTSMTVSLMLPGIFVQVPSGIASQGSVFVGINTANSIVSSNSTSNSGDSTSSLSFGLTMIQVALGISVGLYLSTIIVYPFGKKKTGLFTL